MQARITNATMRDSGNRTISLLVRSAIASVLAVAAATAQIADNRDKLSKLGPDGFATLPPLESLVDFSDAAVIGRVVGAEGLTLREVTNTRSVKKSIFGYANYRIAIDEVLFTRNPVHTDSLIPGSEIVIGMEVGRDSAEKFLSGKLPAAADDSCLLFLYSRPHGWVLSGWHTQFRRNVGVSAAENLGGAPFAAMAASSDWRGASVTAAETSGGVAPEWRSLVTEVRRLGAQPVSARRRQLLQ
jgi:hypothetical protein